MTEPGAAHRGFVAALTAALLLVVAGYGAIASMATASLSSIRAGALLANLKSGSDARIVALSDDKIKTAIAAMPLDQGIVNVAMVHEAGRRGVAITGPWLTVLARLGWRDTPALQNMLYTAAIASNMAGVLNIADALLRQQSLMEQLIPLLSMMELDPTLRGMLVERLAQNPNWRSAYLASVSQDPSRLVARYAFIRALQQRGARLDQVEVIPNIDALDGAGLSRYGFVLWQYLQPGITRPLDDTQFIRASSSNKVDRDPVPYQWQVLQGDGFSADVSRDGARASLSLDWNGRGVPVFAQQRTSAMPGRYALDVQAEPDGKADLQAFVFRLVCGGDTIIFQQTGSPAHYVTASPVPCSYPLLQIAGDVQPSTVDHQVIIDRVTMTMLHPGER